MWAFRAILGERTAANGAKEYLIEWEDDPDTGEKYEPTWEVEANVPSNDIAEWEEEQERLAQEPGSSIYDIPSSPVPESSKRRRSSLQQVLPETVRLRRRGG